MRWARACVAVLGVFIIGVSAFGGGGMSITLTNNTSSTIVVTVYDLNANHQAVLSGEEINGFASIAVSITPDASGHGHITWNASNGDRDFRLCGHRDKPGLNDGDTVKVYANSSCGGN